MDWVTIEKMILASDPVKNWSGVSKGITVISHYKEEVNLRIECKYDDEDVQNLKFVEKWANMHPNPQATGYYFNIYYASTLLKRIVLVSIDGGNALLPLPDSNMKVKKFDYKIAKVFDNTQSLDNYLLRSGLSVIK